LASFAHFIQPGCSRPISYTQPNWQNLRSFGFVFSIYATDDRPVSSWPRMRVMRMRRTDGRCGTFGCHGSRAGSGGAMRAVLSSMRLNRRRTHPTPDTSTHVSAWLAASGWSRASRMGVTNLQIIGCHLGHDRPFLPSTGLPIKPDLLLDVAKPRFIWSQTPEFRNSLSAIPSGPSWRRPSARGVSRIPSDGNGCRVRE
jgi:hypothetical protein